MDDNMRRISVYKITNAEEHTSFVYTIGNSTPLGHTNTVEDIARSVYNSLVFEKIAGAFITFAKPQTDMECYFRKAKQFEPYQLFEPYQFRNLTEHQQNRFWLIFSGIYRKHAAKSSTKPSSGP